MEMQKSIELHLQLLEGAARPAPVNNLGSHCIKCAKHTCADCANDAFGGNAASAMFQICSACNTEMAQRKLQVKRRWFWTNVITTMLLICVIFVLMIWLQNYEW